MLRQDLTALDALDAFARLTAVVRHFSPATRARTTDWDAFVARHAPRLAAPTTAHALAAALRTAFGDVDPHLEVHVGTPDMPAPPFARDVTFVVHVPSGDSTRAFDLRAPLLARVRVDTPDQTTVTVPDLPEVGTLTLPFPGFAPYTLPLPGGLTATIPLVRPTVPDEREETPPTPPLERASLGARYAAVMDLWGTLAHLYPLWALLDVDWTAQLRKALAGVPDATTEDAMTSVLEGLLAPLTDAHVFVRPASFAGPDGHALPFALGVIEDALLVVNAEPGTDVEVGDEVIELDGRDARVLLDAACARISARPVVAQFRAARSLVTRAAPGEATLLVARNGGRLDVRVSTREGPPVSLQARPEPLADLGGGVVYLDVTRVGGEQYEQVLGVLAAARAIVIDARGYPTDLPLRLLPHLTDEEMRSPPFLVPVVAHPDISRTRFVDVSTVMFQPAEPRLTRHVAVVIDANGTQSYAESVLALVAAYGLGTLVGEATTGTNGVVALRTLASGHRVRWTSWWVRQHDGSELFGRGVQPEVEVRRSVRGVRAGRDELLDAALNVVQAELVTSG